MIFLASLFTMKAKAMVYNMATLFIRFINGNASIIVQHNYNNDTSNEDISKVLPYNLCALRASPICISIHQNKLGLESIKWDVQSIEVIENDY